MLDIDIAPAQVSGRETETAKNTLKHCCVLVLNAPPPSSVSVSTNANYIMHVCVHTAHAHALIFYNTHTYTPYILPYIILCTHINVCMWASCIITSFLLIINCTSNGKKPIIIAFFLALALGCCMSPEPSRDKPRDEGRFVPGG